MRNENIFFVCLLAIMLVFASCGNNVTRIRGTVSYSSNRYYNTSFRPFHFWRRPGIRGRKGYYAHPRHHYRHMKARWFGKKKHGYYRYLRKTMSNPKGGWRNGRDYSK
jgi:hypothetical protein